MHRAFFAEKAYDRDEEARMKRCFLVFGVVFLSFFHWSCGDVPITAPSGTTLTITANPATIPLTGGQSTITVTAFKSNGYPVPDDTVINLQTTLGSVEPEITTHGGIAHGTLRSTGTAGTATVSAFSGNVGPQSVDVTIGQSVTSASITLTATPASLPAGGGDVMLRAVVFGSGGTVEGADVSFTQTAGSLVSGGVPVRTNAQGVATDTLTTTEASTVTATTAGASGTLSAEVTISVGGASADAAVLLLTADPIVLPPAGGTATLIATVFDSHNDRLAGAPVLFTITAGAGTLGTAGTITTDSSGVATNTLTTTVDATIRATSVPATVYDDLDVVVGSSGLVLTLTQDRETFTNLSDWTAIASACTADPAHPQLPATFTARLENGSGNPIDGTTVVWIIDWQVSPQPFGTFCPIGLSVTCMTGTSAPGECQVQFSMDNDDRIFCAGLTANFCQTRIVAHTVDTEAGNDLLMEAVP
jgi:hypothetical protein